MEDKIYDCSVGILTKNNKFLVEKRKMSEVRDAGLVILPGGHVEDGETHMQALVREMKEELDIGVKKVNPNPILIWPYRATDGERQMLFYFDIQKYTGTPTAITAERIYWTDDINVLDIKPDRLAIEKLRKI